MNRSILIVICDFLLVSLLVFSSPDMSKVNGGSDEAAVPAPVAATNTATSGGDLAAVMRTALTEEQQKRERPLQSELDRSRQTAAQQQSQLTENEKQAQALQRQQANLEEQYTPPRRPTYRGFEPATDRARHRSDDLEKNNSPRRNRTSSCRKTRAAALKKQLADLQKSHHSALAANERLTNQLQLADLERRHAAEQAAQAQQQVEIERREKAQRLQQQATKLAEGVQNARQANPANSPRKFARTARSPSNTIFNDFVTNAVESTIYTASRPGFFGGESTRGPARPKLILVTDGTNTFSACHVQDTPLTFWIPATDWEALTATLQGASPAMSSCGR